MLAPEQADLPVGPEPVVAEHARGDGEPVGVQRELVLAVQVRAAKGQPAADAGAGQADPPVGPEPVDAEHVRGDGEPVGVQGELVLAVQVRAAKAQLPPMLAPARLISPSARNPSRRTCPR